MGLSQEIADHAAGVDYQALPESAVAGAKRSLLDAIGVSLGATGLEPACNPFIAYALGLEGRRESSIFGQSVKAPASAAAFANGALAHALDFEDAYDGAPSHPNASVIPAALALAEAREVAGKGLVAAIALGADLACRIALCVQTPAEANGWYPPPIYGAFGAVAAAGKAVSLDAPRYLDAFSLALNLVTCSGEIKQNPQSVIRAVRDAFPSQSAVQCAQLAADGVAGFKEPFEGKYGFFRLYVNNDYDERVILDGLGRDFLGARVSYKPWPACRGTHAFIEAALDIRQQAGFDLHAIKAIDLRGAPLLQMLMQPAEGKRAPTTAIDAKFSLPFVSATALARGRVTLDEFIGEALSSQGVLSLARLVKFDERIADDFGPDAGEMTVRLMSGEAFTRKIQKPKGAPANPMSWNELVDKAKACAARARCPVSESRIDRLAELIQNIEDESDAAASIFKVLGSA